MRSDELYLSDIAEACTAIGEFLRGVERNEFYSNELLQSAILQKLAVIGEAAARISDEIKDRYPEIEWKPIIGMRNILVHAYFSIKWEFIWVTASEQIVPLKRQIVTILNHEFPDTDSNIVNGDHQPPAKNCIYRT